MKNASLYAKKIKKLLRGSRSPAAPDVPPGEARVRMMIELVLQADATQRQAAAAVGPLLAEYVDLNELRVSPIKDITDLLGKSVPAAREKAEMMVTVLNRIFARANDVSLDWLAERPKREMRRTLIELGLGPYAGAAVAMLLFGVPAVPVDQTLTRCLKADGYVHGDSDITEVQALLEKVVSPRSVLAAHQALRKYCEKRAKTLPKPPPPAPVAPPPPPVPAAPAVKKPEAPPKPAKAQTQARKRPAAPAKQRRAQASRTANTKTKSRRRR